MAQEGSNSRINIEQFLKSVERFISLKTIFIALFIFFVAIVGNISKNIYNTQTDIYKNKIYDKININIQEQYGDVLKETLSDTLLIASSLSKNSSIKDALVTADNSKINFNILLHDIRTSDEYRDIQIEIVDKDGISFKRSWTTIVGDDLVKYNTSMAHLIKYPRVVTAIESSKFGMVMSSKIPIYKNDIFLGLFIINMHFNSIVDGFINKGYNSVILMNKIDSRKVIPDISYSRRFLNDCYVVNSNADKYLIRILSTANLESFFADWDNNFKISILSEHVISKYIIRDDTGYVLGNIFIFRSLDDIDFEDMEFIQQAHVIATLLFIIFIAFLINYFYTLSRIKSLNIENEQLVITNEDLKTKTDEMDFNDKKLDNMFNMQPNLMIMHNGKEVTKGNKRFMGFFNRFGTFDGFKKKHKCVSELFEEYKAPNYIWEQHIEGEFWVDYIIANPRRLYKTVMSVVNRQGVEEPHHFIIKLNEMDYAKHVSERIIVIALVDMTQDLVNYKTLDESARDLRDMKDKLEVKEEMINTDLSYIFAKEIENTFHSVTNQNILNYSIVKSDVGNIEKDKFVQVNGIYKFSNIESQWFFIVPAKTASIILEMMMKVNNSLFDNIEDNDILSTSNEFIYGVSTMICKKINEEKYHDLDNARYIESNVDWISKKDIGDLDNLYTISLELENKELYLYTSFDNDILPFISGIIEGKTLEDKPKDTETKKVVVEEKKIIEQYRKLDINSLIENSTKDTLDKMMSVDTKLVRMVESKMEDIKDRSCVRFENEFRMNKNSFVWTFIIPAQTLSLIYNIVNNDRSGMVVDIVDSSLQSIAKNIVDGMIQMLLDKTNNLVKLTILDTKVCQNVLFDYKAKLYSINLGVENQNIDMYILIKES